MRIDKEKLKEIILEFLVGATIETFAAALVATLRWIVTAVIDYFT